MIQDKLQAINQDLEELASRGFGHQDAQAIVGRMRVALEQVASAAGGPPPEPEPVQAQLVRLNLAVAALAENVGPVLQRQVDAFNEIGILSGQVAKVTETLQAMMAGQAAAAP